MSKDGILENQWLLVVYDLALIPQEELIRHGIDSSQELIPPV
jgi:hypothetical protein